MCSWDWFFTVPTITVGFLPSFDCAAPYQGRDRQSEIISSATRRESVSFQRPLTSLTSPASMRCTEVPPHAVRTRASPTRGRALSILVLRLFGRELVEGLLGVRLHVVADLGVELLG